MTVESVVLLHDGPRLWLTTDPDGRLCALRHAGPPGLDEDRSRAFDVLPDDIWSVPRETRFITELPRGSSGNRTIISAFDADLPPTPPTDGPLGPLVEARLGRTAEYAGEGLLGDPETQIALWAIAWHRLKRGDRL